MQGPPDSQPDASAEQRASPDDSSAPYGDLEPTTRKGVIPRTLLDDHAVFVVRRLQQNGHEAYLVGGCVRDLLSGLEPKDFDVATDARPNRIKRLFRSARVIGRRFRLVHIRFPGDHIIETATFRGDPMLRDVEMEPPPEELDADVPRRRRDWRTSAENIFGTAPEDAHRRDFTINALFYDPVRDRVIDWVGGLEDLDQGVVRSIGDPAVRIAEDPVRMLRAAHFARRMDFTIEPGLEAAMREHAGQLADASQARLYVELVKILARGRARATFRTLYELGLLHVWLPELAKRLDEPATWPAEDGGTHEEASQGEPETVPVAHATWNLLGAADRYGLAARGIHESIRLAVLFGSWLLDSWNRSGLSGWGAYADHFDEEFRPVAVRMSVPRACTIRMRDMIWMLPLLRHPPDKPKAKARLLSRPAFFDALLLFELDLAARDANPDAAQVWRDAAESAGVTPRTPRPKQARRRDAGGSAGGRGRGRRGGRRRGGRGRRPNRGPRDTPTPEAGAWTPPPPPTDGE